MSSSVRYSKNLGRYNWAGTEKSWCLQLFTQFGNVSETFDESDEPDSDGLLPSEVLELISARLESHWISTSREETRKKIEVIRDHAYEIDKSWLEQQIVFAERKVRGLKDQLAELEPEDISA